MVRKLFIVICLICCYLYGITQQHYIEAQQLYSSDDTLHWSKDRKLTWDDFQGVPDTNSTGMAGTSSDFWYHSYYTSDTTLVFVVNTIFFKKHSWVKSEYKDLATLNHEQGHYNISEVYARKLNQAFKNYKLNKTTVLKDCDKIYDSLRIERDKMQKLYDKETTKPINSIKQEEWDLKIDKWLRNTNINDKRGYSN